MKKSIRIMLKNTVFIRKKISREKSIGLEKG